MIGRAFSVIGVVLFLVGCAPVAGVEAERERAKEAKAGGDKVERAASTAEAGKPKTRIVNSLLQVLDTTNNEAAKEDERRVRDDLKTTLSAADEKLDKVLGDNSKRLIMKANQKPPTICVGAPVGARPKTPVSQQAESPPVSAKPSR